MDFRRNARLRREYLYKKSLEGKEKEQFERKERLKKALQEGTQIPADLAKEAGALRAEVELDDIKTSAPRSHIDDEYALAGIRDPKVCVTTSRDPSSRLRQFSVEVRLVFPNSQRMNRGNTTVKELVDIARKADFTDIVLLQVREGRPTSPWP
jgi:U3 small nucleolar ribonucleoprotein protein IMP4